MEVEGFSNGTTTLRSRMHRPRAVPLKIVPWVRGGFVQMQRLLVAALFATTCCPAACVPLRRLAACMRALRRPASCSQTCSGAMTLVSEPSLSATAATSASASSGGGGTWEEREGWIDRHIYMDGQRERPPPPPPQVVREEHVQSGSHRWPGQGEPVGSRGHPSRQSRDALPVRNRSRSWKIWRATHRSPS